MPTDHLHAGAVKVARRLREAGHEAWFAGGCVRDRLLGRTPKDWDVATDALPERVQALFPRTVAIGAAFGVVQVLDREGRAYEVATFRTDGDYVDGRRPTSVVYARSREEDVRRRDFTINALLMDPETDAVLDYVGGQADLAAGIVRAVGAPADRFGEDRLRMLRAVRFAARLGFVIEPATWAALVAEAPRLGVVSPERITAELEGIFASPSPGHGVRLLEASGLAAASLPAARSAVLADRFDRLPAAAEGLSPDARLEVAWALVHRELEPAAVEAALRARRLSRATLRAVQDLLGAERAVEAAEDGAPRAPVLRLARGPAAATRAAYLEAVGGRASRAVARFEAARARMEAEPPAEEALLGGRDLQALGLSPGPGFKAILDAVEAAALEGRVRTRAEAITLVRALGPTGEAP